MEHAPTVTLSYAFVNPEGIERLWSRSRPMALALARSISRASGRKLLASSVAMLVRDGGTTTSKD